MEQIRVPIAELQGIFERLLGDGAWADVARSYPPARG